MPNTFNISSAELDQLNKWAGFLSFIPTNPLKSLLACRSRKILLITGNQFGKTSSAAYDYVLRIMGLHPVEYKNIRPNDQVRTFRFASETLPMEGSEGETRNTQYPAFRKWLPYELVKKDISANRRTMTIKCVQGGPDIFVEFVSYNQDIQAMAGVQRKSIWLDEEPHLDFYHEQIPRLLAANGDIVFTMTPIEISWVYDELFERAKYFYRTEPIIAFYKQAMGLNMGLFEETDSTEDIAVIQASTDDNPTLDPDAINELFSGLDDDTLAMRRYGIFKQVSGRIFKDFAWNIHVIEPRKYLPDGIGKDWCHARGIDYHEHNPWACGWMSLNPYDEAFIWNEFNPSPDNSVTFDIARFIALQSRDYKYRVDLIDPLAGKKQLNTGYSTTEDLNRYFFEFRREGICTGAYWIPWDTKTTVGRDEIKVRLKNARIVGKPGNNEVVDRGVKKRLPTLWVLNNCRISAQSMKNWRWEEWNDRSSKENKDLKDKVNQKYSHFNMVWEAMFKHPAFRVATPTKHIVNQRSSRYFTRR